MHMDCARTGRASQQQLCTRPRRATQSCNRANRMYHSRQFIHSHSTGCLMSDTHGHASYIENHLAQVLRSQSVEGADEGSKPLLGEPEVRYLALATGTWLGSRHRCGFGFRRRSCSPSEKTSAARYYATSFEVDALHTRHSTYGTYICAPAHPPKSPELDPRRADPDGGGLLYSFSSRILYLNM